MELFSFCVGFAIATSVATGIFLWHESSIVRLKDFELNHIKHENESLRSRLIELESRAKKVRESQECKSA